MRRDASNSKGKFVWNWIIPNVEFEVEGDPAGTRRVKFAYDFRDSLLDFVFVAKAARDRGPSQP